MSHNIWRRWVSRLFKQNVRTRPRKHRRLGLESLEDRVVPATDTWTGLATGATAPDWSNVNNWSLNRAPITGDTVVFNSTGLITNRTLIDNLTTNPILSSVNISGTGYTLGNAGGSTLIVSGGINVASSENTITITQPVEFLPPLGTPQETITVNNGSILDLAGPNATGQVTAASNVTVSVTGTGTLEIASANPNWLGALSLANTNGGGIVQVANANALGSTTVTVNTNTQLQLVGGMGSFTITNSLLTNGSGIVNDGALLNVTGNNTWSGPIQMDSDTTFGTGAATQLTITGTLSDNGAGHNLTKEGAGTLVFPNANTYRGTTTVNNGILEIENPLSLGAGANALDSQSGSPQSETIVNDNPTANEIGTLELNFNSSDVVANDPNGILQNPALPFNATTNSYVGFQVFNDILVLNGAGFNGIGALDNTSGDNEWDGSVILGSAPPALAFPVINTAAKTQLIVSGIISDPNQTSMVYKIGTGELVFNDANTYRDGTDVEAGILDIDDSQALGMGTVYVVSGAALQLDVDQGFDGTAQRTHNRNLGFDSVNGSGAGQELDITGTSGTFTLSLGGQTSSVLSITSPTLTADIQNALNGPTGLLALAGLPETVVSVTQDGSIYRIIFNVNGPANDVPLMTATAVGGAKVTVNPIYGLTVANSLVIDGPGVGTKPDTGALDSNSGINTYTGTIFNGFDANIPPSVLSQLGTAAIGVAADSRPGHPLADNDYLQWDYSLTVVGQISGGDLVKTGLGNLILPNSNIYGNTIGIANPTTDIQLGWITIENDLSLGENQSPAQANIPQTKEPYVEIDKGGALHLDPQPGTSLTLYDNFFVTGTGLTSPTYGLISEAGAIENLNGDNTLAGIIQLDGTVGIGVEQIPSTSPNPPNVGFPPLLPLSPPLTASQLTLTGYLWNYTNPTTGAVVTGGITKLGSRRLIIQGSGTYTGNVDVQVGVLLVQNDTALGAGNSTSPTPPTVTVEDGAALEFGNTINGENVGNGFTSENGGIQDGIEVWGEHLILNGSGDPTFDDSALTVLASNAPITGPTVQTVTVTGSTTGYFFLSFGGVTTGPISATATAAQVQAALANILSTGQSVAVVQSGNVYTITFGGSLINTSTQLLAINSFTPSSGVVAVPVVPSGNFSLTFPSLNGQTTTSLSASSTAAQVQAALNALSSINGAASVTLNANGTAFIITFSGALASTTLPIELFTGTFVFPNSLANITEIGTTSTVVAPVNDPIVATDAIWRGPVTLGNDTTITTDTNSTLPSSESASRLILTGTVSDLYTGSPTSPPPSDLTILGGGEVDLDGANTYSGTTYIQQGVVAIDNPQALGTTGVSEIQTVTLTGAVANTTQFMLTFQGYAGINSPLTATEMTSEITYTGVVATDEANITKALNALSTIGGGTDTGGSVSVVETIVSGKVTITVTFGGTLSGFPQDLMGATVLTGSAGAVVARVQAGAGGTVVEDGASLQVAGSFTVAGEPLILEGNGTTQDIQTVAVTGGSTGTFTLSFTGPDATGTTVTDTTTLLNVTSTTLASDIQTALDALANIGGVGGSVTVSGTAGAFTVAFGGTLSGDDVQTLVANTGGVSGGTITTQTTQAGVPTIAGVPTQWFQVGPAPTSNGQTDQNQPVSGAVTAEAVDPRDPTVMYVGTAGGGVWKSIDNGNSWQPIFDAVPEIQTLTIPEIQTLTVSGGTTGTFRLSFTGSGFTSTTSLLNAASPTLANDIQTALDALSNIGGAGGSVTVTKSGATYTIIFNGALGAANQTPLSVVNVSLVGGTVTAVQLAQTGTFTLGFTGPNSNGIVVTDTTSVLNVASPTLAGDIQSALDALSNIGGVGGQVTVTQSGSTFMITFNGTLAGASVNTQSIPLVVNNISLSGTITPQEFEAGLDPNFSMYVGAIAVDPENSNIIYVGTGQADTASDTVQNSVSNNAFYGTGVYESTDGGLTWSLLLDNSSSPGQINPATGTTLVNPLVGMGVTGIAVDPDTGSSANPTIYVSDGVVGGTGVGLGVPNGNNGEAEVVQGIVQPGGTGQLAGVWRYTSVNGSTSWFDLTDVVSSPRATLDGKQSAPPDTPGPDDDFRVQFPEVNDAVWTDVQVIDTGIAEDGGKDGSPGTPVPVVYAALGSPGQWGGENISPLTPLVAGSPAQLGDNAVYRAYNPESDSPTWYIGDPGTPVDQIETITFTDPGGANLVFNLGFNGVFSPNTLYNPNINMSGIITNILDNLSTIGGLGAPGGVTVAQTSQTATVSVYTVTFGGGLSDVPLPLIQTKAVNGLTIQVSITTPGGGVDTETNGEFPTYFVNGSLNGDIRLSVVAPPPGPDDSIEFTTVYAAVPNSTTGDLLNIYESSTGGLAWGTVSTLPLEYMNGQGNYANDILAVNASTVYVGGDAANLEDPTSMIFMTVNGGATWTDVTKATAGNSPHNAVHTLVADGSDVIAGTDGGIWQLNVTTTTVAPIITTVTWNDLNSNLATAEVNGVDAAQSNPNDIVVGTEGNGLAYFSNLLEWTESDENGAAGDGPSGGTVYIDPDNANFVYAVLSSPPPGSISSNFLESTDGGKTWSPVASLPTVDFTSEYPYFTFLVDPLNPNRLLVGGPWVSGGLEESLNGGVSWLSLTDANGSGPLFGFNITSIAVAGYQGVFVSDPTFPDVTDLGANVDDSNTIYISNGSTLLVTKDLGLEWVNRTPPIVGTIQSITVNPANRDNVFVVTQGTPNEGLNQIWESTDGGQSWNLIGGAGSSVPGLADIPLWQLAIDPRTGTLYVGTDNGVYDLANAAPLTPQGPAAVPTVGTVQWERFGTGMPNVSVRILELNLSTNTLLAGTYGRGVYQLFLDATETATDPIFVNGTETITPPATGAAIGLSGASFWTGPVILVGDAATNDVTVGADGTQDIPDGITAASINFVGPISDLTMGSNPTLTKDGNGDVIFSGDNTYGGLTTVGQGNLIAENLDALGGNTNGTTVIAGASLGLLANLDAEPVTLNGNGISFDAHYLGALRNISGFNTFTGNVIVNLPDPEAPQSVTIEADSGSVLTMEGAISGGGLGFTLVKEGTGTVILDNTNPNTYTGITSIYQGALQAETSSAFSNGTVEVLDGAQVQVQDPQNIQTLTSTATSGTFTLSFTGPDSTGTTVTDTTTTLKVTSVTLVSDIQAALNALANIGGVGGSVTVSLQSPGVYTVIFGGTLFGETVQTLAVNNLTLTGGTIAAQTIQAGGPAVNIANPLLLSGTGINSTGAILDTGGNNTWSGPITFEILPGFAPLTLTRGTVALGADAGATLTLSGPIDEEASPAQGIPNGVLPMGLLKVGAGTVALSNVNHYSGSTEVAQGILDVQNSAALGDRTTVGGLDTIEQIVTLSNTGANGLGTGEFTLSFDGKTATASKLNFGTSASAVQNVLEGAGGGGGLFASAGLVGATVQVYRTAIQTTTENGPSAISPANDVTGWVYTLIFGGSLAQTSQQVEAIGIQGTLASTNVVAAGGVDVLVDSTVQGAGELELDNSALLPAGTGLVVSNYTLTLNGSGPTGNGALYNLVGDNTWSGPVILAANDSLPSTTHTRDGVGVSAPTTTNPDDSLKLTDVLSISNQVGSLVPAQPELDKVGPGTLIFPAGATYTGQTTFSTGDSTTDLGTTVITAGSLQVDATGIGAILLGGGTVSGVGSVKSINNTTTAASGGTIDPGDNYPNEASGLLTSSGNVTPPAIDVNLNSNDTVFVNLGLPSNANLPPSSLNNNDVFDVTGTINLNGATLNGLVNVNVAIGDSYTIINAGLVEGEFNGSSVTPTESGATAATIAYIGGVKFEVDYFSNRVDVFRELVNETMTLTPSVPSPVYGQDEQFTATLTSTDPSTPTSQPPLATGTVVFTVFNDLTGITTNIDVPLPTSPATGVAILDLPVDLNGPLMEGEGPDGYGYQVSATYSGIDANGNATFTPIPTAPAQPPSATVTVGSANTTTSLALTYPLPEVYGETFTIVATVATTQSSTVVNTLAPAGSVSFYDGAEIPANLLATVPLTSPPPGTTTATATLVSTALSTLVAAGNHTINAVYNENNSPENYLSSSSSIGLSIHQAASTVTVTTPSIPTPVYGQVGVTFTATVASTSGSGNPTGTVTFEDGSQVLGTATLSTTGGVTTATYTTTAGQLLEGDSTKPGDGTTTTITAVYNGDINFTGNSGTLAEAVDPANTTTTLTSSAPSPPGAPNGQTVTFTATVAPVSPGAGNPTGTVKFFLNGSTSPIGIGALSTTGGVTTASFATIAYQLPVGTSTITATYVPTPGNLNFTGSNSATLSQTITQGSSITIVNTSGASVYGQPVTLTATVKATVAGGPIPTGTVAFYVTVNDSLVQLGTGTLGTTGGVTTTSYTTTVGQLPVAANEVITAIYNGNSQYSSSTGTTFQTVSPDNTSTILTSSGPVTPLESVTFTAQVVASSPGGGNPTGTVNFMVGSTSLGSATLTTLNGVTTAQITVPASELTVGTNTITATYGGDGNFFGSTGSMSQVVEEATTTIVNTSTSPSLYGQQVTLTATITPNLSSNVSPTGTVTFSVGSTTLGTAPVIAGSVSSTAILILTSLPVGTNETIVASYSGDTNFIGSTGSVSQTVNKTPTKTTLSSTATSIELGQPVIFTVQVAPVAPGGGIPTGKVTFKNGAAIITTVPLVDGVATFQRTLGTVGKDSITAVYSGDTNDLASTSAPVVVTVAAVGVRLSKVTVASSANPSFFGQTVTFTATVKDAGVGAAHTPTGTVDFFSGTTLLGYGTLSTSGGVTTANFFTSALPLGTSSITAAFNGNATFAHAVSAAIIQTVKAAPVRPSVITLSASSATSTYGVPVTFSATVTDEGTGTPQTPTGTVTFTATNTVTGAVFSMGSGTLSGANGVATATINFANLPGIASPGDTYNITASYSGDGSFFQEGNLTAPLTHTVTLGSTAVTLTSSLPSGSVYGQAVIFTATVSIPGSTAVPTGAVEFTNGAPVGAGQVIYGTFAINANGVASFKTSALLTGDDIIEAMYTGSPNSGASSATLDQTVNQASTKMALTSTTTSNGPVTMTATVTAVSPGSGIPTGSASFYIDNVFVGVGTLNSTGVVTFTDNTGVSVGNHTITVVYNGDINFLGNEISKTFKFVVGRGT